MAINATIITPIFETSLLSAGFAGLGRPRLSGAIAEGLFSYMTSGVVSISIDAGTLGSGVGNGIGVVLASGVIQSAMLPIFAGHGILGVFSPPLVASICNGISTALASATLTGVHSGVGVGTGKLQLTPNGAGNVLFQAAFAQFNVSGIGGPRIASAMAEAMDASITSAQGLIIISGSPSNLPSSGVGQIIIS